MATHASFMPGVKVQNRVWTWLTTVDHKRIGILYGTTSFVFFLLAGLESLLMRVQLARPDSTLIGPQAYNELFTMHGTTMIFLAVMPLSTAFINSGRRLPAAERAQLLALSSRRSPLELRLAPRHGP